MRRVNEEVFYKGIEYLIGEEAEIEECFYIDKGIRWCEWKDDPEEVLQAIDAQLEAFGLEVIWLNDHDIPFWKIEKRVEEEVGFGRIE